MKELSQIISYSLPVLYLAVIYIYYLIFSEKNKSLVHKTTPILLFLVICHLIEITTRNIAIGSLPLSSTHDAYAFFAFSVLVVYMISELGLENRGAGLFILSFSFVFELISVFNMSWEHETSELLLNNKTFIVHASISITGYTALSLAAIYALMYIIQNYNLKRRKLGRLFSQLPALTYLEKMNRRSILTGIILLGIGIMLGHYQMMISGEYLVKDIKVIITDAVWILYIIMYLLAIKNKWSGEKVAFMSFYGFVVLIIGGGILIYLSDSFHEFN